MGTRHCKLTSSFTSTTNHMISAPFCQNAERIFTPARPLLDLSGFSCLVIRRLKHLLLLFCVCVCVCVHPAVTKFITLGMDPALHYTSVDNICREGKKIINDLIFEICGKGRIWVTSRFSFFWFYFFLLPPAAVQILEVSKNASINLRIINFLCREYAPVCACECAPNCLCERLIYVIRLI